MGIVTFIFPLTSEFTWICRHAGRIRVERIDHQFSYSEGFDYISGSLLKQSSRIESVFTMCFEADTFVVDQIASAITDLPQLVVVALAVTFKHLSAFGLSDPLLQIQCFHKFVTRAYMSLDASTLKNL
jgi:hypothetical protein